MFLQLVNDELLCMDKCDLRGLPKDEVVEFISFSSEGPLKEDVVDLNLIGESLNIINQ